LVGWFGLGAWFGFGQTWLKHNPAPVQAAVAPRPSALSPQPKLEAVAISKMKVGDQVPADNPTGEKDTEFGDTVDPPNWRKLVLLAPKKDGSTADVELLRPLWWLEEQQAEVGGTVDIHVPECGIEGKAQVLAIEPCPTIKPRSGLRVVTGTFKHQASNVLDVYVEGLNEPIGATPNHPFWSEDRQTFVRADELKEGEHLHAFNGTPIVRRVVPLADPEPVFNLEVQCDHVYHVARNGVLVHNSEPCSIVYRLLRDGEDVMAGLVARNPAAQTTLTNSVRNGSRMETQYIATSRSLDYLLDYARRHGLDNARIAVIDLQRVAGSRIYDLSTDAARQSLLTNPIARNYAGRAREVVIEGGIPADAIIGLIQH
jgi:hypothetical protein